MKYVRDFCKNHEKLLSAVTEQEAANAYCATCEIRQLQFPGKCAMADCDRCFLTREYNDVIREIRRRPQQAVTFNLYGCDVTINTH